MSLTNNMAVAFSGSVANIPAGWSRVTELDSRYILGATAGSDADLTTDRGYTTHSHTSPAHTPIQQPHTHFFYNPGSTASTTVVSSSTTVSTITPNAYHDHEVAESDPVTAINNSVSVTIDPTSNDLSYAEVIWIKPASTATVIPVNGVAFYDEATLPAGWTLDLTNRYLKGAGTGAGGGAVGGSNTHSHTSPEHTHTQQTHQHTGISGYATLRSRRGTGSTTIASPTHTHTLTLNATAAVNQAVETTFSTDNHEPPFCRLSAIKATAADLPDKIICLWLSTAASIPTNWSRYAAMDGKFLKTTTTSSDLLVTGGAAQHNHLASDCQPVQDSHTHTVTDPGSVGTTTGANTGTSSKAGSGHTHTGWVVDANTAVNDPCAVTVDNCSSGAAYPKHRTVIFIKYSKPTGPTPTRYVTTYSAGEWEGNPHLETRPLPEVEARIRAGDRRYMGQENGPFL
jgi:hypothetical protein